MTVAAAAAALAAKQVRRTDVAVIGAGALGNACALYLSRTLPRGSRIVVVDSDAPVSWTSSLSTECYRDTWPTRTMTAMLSDSIDLLDAFSRECEASETGGFGLSRRGYAYFRDSRESAAAAAELYASLGHEVRRHESADTVGGATYQRQTDGVDLLLGNDAVRAAFGDAVGEDVPAAIHARRCGWFSAQQMCVRMLERARDPSSSSQGCDVEFLRGEVVSATASHGGTRADSVLVRRKGSGATADEQEAEVISLSASAFINAAGPRLGDVHAMFSAAAAAAMESGTEPSAETTAPSLPAYPLRNELHAKAVLRDVDEAVPRSAPMMIWDSPQSLAGDMGLSEDDAAWLAESDGMGEERATLLCSSAPDAMPAGVHLRPYGKDSLLLLWECWHAHLGEEEMRGDGGHGELPRDATPWLDSRQYADICLRGLSQNMVPALARYVGTPHAARCAVDGGFYTSTPENVPLIGPASSRFKGLYTCGAASGFGIMAAHAAGALVAAHVAAETSELGEEGSAAVAAAAAAAAAKGTFSSSSSSSHPGARRVREYCEALLPARFEDEEYVRKVDQIGREMRGSL